MTIVYHKEMIQGSDEWYAARCGLLTASEMHLIFRIPKEETRVKKNGEPYKQREYSPAEGAAESAHLYELLAQRVTGYVEPSYVGDAMLRGMEDEVEAVELYAKEYAPIERVGFVTNDKWGFTLGYSPDALVGDEGLLECKSRKQRLQMQTIVEYVNRATIAPEFMVQVQTGLLVSEREWCDLISYCGGLPMATVRVLPNPEIQQAIVAAATAFENRIKEAAEQYSTLLKSHARLIPTERRIEQEMYS